MLITVTIEQEGQRHQERIWCYIWSSQLLCSGLVPRRSGSGNETTSAFTWYCVLNNSVTTLWEFHMKCVQWAEETLSCDAVKHLYYI